MSTSPESESTPIFGRYLINDHKKLTSTNSSIISRTVLVGKSLVEVGPEPGEVDNFRCISENWKELECSWKVPQNNVFTYYTIEYSPLQWPTEKMPCPNDDDKTKNSCRWTLSSTPPYRKFVEALNISITGTNKYGKIRQDFTFYPYEHMHLLEPVKDLRVAAKNSTSVTVQWDIGELQYFPKTLEYLVYFYPNKEWGSEWKGDLSWKEKDTNRQPHILLTITNLTANSKYDLAVSLWSTVNLDKYINFGTRRHWQTNIPIQT